MPVNEQDNILHYQQRPSATGPSPTLKNSDGDGTFEGMDKERLARLEGAFDGIRSNQAILMTAVGLVSALLIGLASFTVVQNVGINSRISELPGKINSDLRDITKTLSEAITASKQPAPQVILMPAPPMAQQQPSNSDGTPPAIGQRSIPATPPELQTPAKK
jgi:hypothetical protein